MIIYRKHAIVHCVVDYTNKLLNIFSPENNWLNIFTTLICSDCNIFLNFTHENHLFYRDFANRKTIFNTDELDVKYLL